jgi:hemolysin activation/secretion protein
MKLIKKPSFIFLCLLLGIQDSYAATSSSVPGLTSQNVQSLQGLSNFFDAGRVTKQVQQSLPRAPKATLKPTAKPKSDEADKVAKIHFKFNGVIITGNTIFSEAELRKVFRPGLKKDIPLAELQQMVHSITTKYRDAGYILSRAILPPQTIKRGIVHVQVIEGFVSSVAVKGDSSRLNTLMMGYAVRIKASRPLQVQKLERYALLANDLPGVSVQSVLTPSKNIPAGADLTLVSKQKIGSAFVSYDNFGTRYIGPNEVSFGGSLYSLLTPGDSTNARFSVTSHTHELHFMELTRTQPIGTDGLRWSLGTNYAETRPDFVLTPLLVVGHNTSVFTDFSYPIIRDRSKNLVVHAGANYQNVTSSILSAPFYQDRLRTVVIGGALDIIDSWRGINDLGVDLTHGLDIMGAHDHENQSRPQGKSIYTRLNITLSRLQSLSSRFSLFGALHGQYTRIPLLATEQFGIGGSDLGRGYDPSEIVGDKGLSAKLELRMDTMPGFRFLNAIQYYVFYDGGMIWNNDTLDLPPKQSLTSMGMGTRFTLLPQVTGNLFIARPLTQPVATLAALNHNIHQARIFFQITASM